ncbi:TonB-dependent receptor [Spirosoma gilvum]
MRLLFTLFCLVSTTTFAQKVGTTITGIIVDKSTKAPVEFATVELLNRSDSTQINGQVTNLKGEFLLNGILPGTYLLRSTFLGYEKVYTSLSVSADQRKVTTGRIEIKPLAITMQEVVVTAKKELVLAAIDRKVYDVSQDLLSQSGTASDILKNVPSVEVDMDGQVSLRGSSDVMILINGRPSPLMGKSRAEVLQQLPANAIERIEVITNPSARYRPDGTSGMINIVMKKNVKGGRNGTILANVGNRDRRNAGISLNYKPGKLNIFTNYSIRKDTRLRYNDIDRQYLGAGTLSTTSYYTEHTQSASPSLSHLITAGAEYTPNQHNVFGISGNFTSRAITRSDQINKHFYDATYQLTSQYDRLRQGPEWQREFDGTVFWEHGFKKEDHSLRMEINISKQQEQEDNHFNNVYTFPAPASTFDNTLIRQGEKQQQVTIDYVNPLSESSKLEAGYAGTFRQQDLDFYGETFVPERNVFVKDAIKTNRFLPNQSIHAFYGTYQKSYRAFSYTLGLRAEQTLFTGVLVNQDSSVRNDYFKIYPTLHFAYKLKTGEVQLNYSRRVHRPDGDELNPFPEYQDPYNIRAGNPKLLPEIIHSVEMGYKWQNKVFSFVPSLYYRYKQNGFTPVTVALSDSVLLTTSQNLSNDKSAGLELIVSANTGRFFSANLSTNFFYNQINAANLGFVGNRSIFSMNTNFISTFTLTPTTSIQISANYRSARLTAQGKNYGSFLFNTGIRQDIFKKKASITFTASNLLNTLKQKTELDTPTLKQLALGQRDPRIIYLGISYRFGRLIKKGSDEKMQFENGL